jgi:hypothetical protein
VLGSYFGPGVCSRDRSGVLGVVSAGSILRWFCSSGACSSSESVSREITSGTLSSGRDLDLLNSCGSFSRNGAAYGTATTIIDSSPVFGVFPGKYTPVIGNDFNCSLCGRRSDLTVVFCHSSAIKYERFGDSIPTFDFWVSG